MYIELKETNLFYECQKPLQVIYKKNMIGIFKLDLVVEHKIVVELKSTERMDPIYQAQILSYMKLGSYKYGLLLNFNNSLLKSGIKRFVL
ncbi:MAG: GxxExxY protein [Ignavibacteria bacterium]